MTKFLTAFVAVLVVTLTAAAGVALLPDTNHPPHREPSKATASAPPLAAVGGDTPTELVHAVDAAYAIAIAQEQERERTAAQRTSPGTRAGTVAASGDCDGLAIPAPIARRESQCTRGIDTGNGYFGYAQVAGFHWQPGGICAGLTWTDPAQEDECVARLWNDGAGARHWGA